MSRTRVTPLLVMASCLVMGFSMEAAWGELRAISLGQGLPPTVVHGQPLVAFPQDTRTSFQDYTTIPGPSGDMQLSIPMNLRWTGAGWGTWGSTFHGAVYYSNGHFSVTLTLPADVYVLTGYMNANGGGFGYSVDEQGDVLLTYSGYGRDGAVGFLLYSDAPITEFTITCNRDFAIGNFQIGQQPFSDVLYVDSSASSGGGGSWQDAYATIEQALSGPLPVTEIRIAGGVYRPGTSRTSSFIVPPSVTLRGGFAGRQHPEPDATGPEYETILSGDLLGDDNLDGISGRSDNSYHVLTIPTSVSNVTISNLTIRSGNADADFRADQNRGAGALVQGSGARFENCRFERCSAGSLDVIGGGGALYSSQYLTLANCVFRGNRAALGAALMVEIFPTPPIGAVVLQDCAFEENTADEQGGAIYALGLRALSLQRVRFGQNTAAEGGALWAGDLGSLEADDCVWYANTAGNGAAVQLTRCLQADFNGDRAYGNAALGRGGFMAALDSRVTVRSGAFSGNRAERDGGVFRLLNGWLELANGTLVHNRAGFGSGRGGGIRAEQAELSIVNTILAFNRDGQGDAELAQLALSGAAPAVVDYSCVEGWSGQFAGVGSFAADPRLRDPLGVDGLAGTVDDDLHLRADSPCIDAGDATRVPPADERDLDRLPRSADGDGDGTARLDIGADEFASPRLGDLNCSGTVDFEDIDPFVAALVGRAEYQAAYPACDYYLADANRDSTVTFDDIAAFVACLVGGGCTSPS